MGANNYEAVVLADEQSVDDDGAATGLKKMKKEFVVVGAANRGVG